MLLTRLFNTAKSLPSFLGSFTGNSGYNIRSLSLKPQTLPVIQDKQSDVVNQINNLVKSQNEGRLFAVVHLAGKQFKVTPGDIILVEGYWPPTIGDRIRLDKVLLAAGNDFTLVGKPLLKPGLVNVEATIIEKTLTHTKTNFRKKRRKQYMRINFFRQPKTMIRINSVELKKQLN